MVLRLEPLQVYRHTMPYFVPVDQLAENLLNDSISDFLDELSEHAQEISAIRMFPCKCVAAVRDHECAKSFILNSGLRNAP